MDDQTSLISIISTEHGRLRREQRDIRKRELQKALKYGTKTWTGSRWRFEYDGIVYITNKEITTEKTCYPSPLSLVPVDRLSSSDHLIAKQVIAKKPEKCVSHTVLVVDVSGSMNTRDIPLHRDRKMAAYSTMALEYVAQQLFDQTANNRDVVSLIEFDSTASVVFVREPTSWVLFNKLLDRRAISRTYNRRELEKWHDMTLCDSNYLPALEKAEELLQSGIHDDCALSMFFISDGEPTDARKKGLTTHAAMRQMEERMKAIATRYVDQISISFAGFGSAQCDFEPLQRMAAAANEATGAEVATFTYCNKLAHSIGT
jgi:uncharacterized protein YegL